MTPDAVFWERIADMPALEAEQELVARRRALMSENAALAEQHRQPGDAAGRRMIANSDLIGVLNDRIKYLRRLQDAVRWRAAVGALFGDEAIERCVVWMEQQRLTLDDGREDWKPGRPG